MEYAGMNRRLMCVITHKAGANNLKLDFRQWFKPIKQLYSRRIVDVTVGPKLYHLAMTEVPEGVTKRVLYAPRTAEVCSRQ